MSTLFSDTGLPSGLSEDETEFVSYVTGVIRDKIAPRAEEFDQSDSAEAEPLLERCRTILERQFPSSRAG